MADRVVPSAKPAADGGASTTNPTAAWTIPQLPGASRPAYRPKPTRRRRGLCCSLCLYLSAALLLLLVLAALAGATLYLIYRPHRPAFAVDALQISYLNLTAASTLDSKLSLTVTARNPNKRLAFIYDPISVAVTTAAGDVAGAGSVPGFSHGPKNSTVLKFPVAGAGEVVGAGPAAKLRSELRSGGGTAVRIKLETRVRVKAGGLRSRKVGIRVTCDGVRITAPAGKAATASTADGKCEVDMRIKIWKWTF